MSSETAPSPNSDATRAARRRGRLRRAALIAGGMGCVLAIGLATLPWWLPTDWLRARIARDLSTALSAPVRVGPVSLDWTDGVVIRQVDLPDERVPGGSVLAIREVRCGFTPIAWLAGRGLDRLEIVQPTLVIHISEQGVIDLPQPASGGGAAPVAPAARLTHPIVVRDASIQIVTPLHPTAPTIRMGRVRLQRDEKSGLVDVELLDGALIEDIRWQRPGGAWSMRAEVAPASGVEQPAVAEGPSFVGQAELQWSDVSLTAWPVAWWFGPDVALSGRCGGSLRAVGNNDLSTSFTCSIRARDAVWRRGDAPPIAPRKLDVDIAGAWTPTHEALALSRLDVRVPGARISGLQADSVTGAAGTGGDVLVLSPRTDTPFQARLRVDIEDAALLRSWLPFALDDAWETGGGGSLEVIARHTRSERAWRVRAATRGGSLRRADWVDIDPADVVTLDVTARHDIRSDRLDLTRCDITLNDRDTISLSGHRMNAASMLTAPADAPAASRARATADGAADGSLKIAARTHDAESLCKTAPILRRWINDPSGRTAVRGPVDATVDVAHRGGTWNASAQLALAADSALQIEDALHKPVDASLMVDAAASITSDADAWRVDGHVMLRCGRAELAARDVTLVFGASPDGAVPIGDNGLSGAASDVTGRGAWSVRDVAAWRAASPALARAIEQAAASTILAGDVRGAIDGRARLKPAEEGWRLVAGPGEIQVDARDLMIRVANEWVKPAGRTAALKVSRAVDDPGAGATSDAPVGATTIDWKLDALDGSLSWRRDGDADHVTVQFNSNDVRAASSTCVALSRVMDTLGAQGRVSGAVEMIRDSHGARIDGAVDASGCALAWPAGDGASVAWSKSAGAPLTARLVARHAGGSAADATEWRIESGALALGDSTIDVTRGLIQRAAADPADAHGAADPVDPLDRLFALVNRVELAGRCALSADRAAGVTCPAIDRLRAECEMSGRIAAVWSLAADPQRLVLDAEVNADDLSAQWADRVHVRAGRALRASLGLSLHSWRNMVAPRGDVASLELRRFELHDPQWRLSADGHARLARRDGVLALEPSVWNTWRAELRASDLAALHQVATIPALDSLSGALFARVAASGEARGWRLDEGVIKAREVRARLNPPGARPGARPSAPDEVRLDGALQLSAERLVSRDWTVRVNDDDFAVVADLRRSGGGADSGIEGEVWITSHRADLGTVEATLDRWKRAWTGADSITEDGNGAGSDRTPPPRAATDQPFVEIPESWRRFAAASDIRCVYHARDARIPRLAGAGPFETRELRIESAVKGRDVRVGFRCAVNGGDVDGRFELLLDDANPWFDLAYEARRLEAEPNTRPLVEAFFPGLMVDGAITLIDATHQRLFDAPGLANAPVGTGAMILGRGTVVGRAAPVAITRLFPGLNVARFDFSRMENRFEKFVDGRMENHMIFIGDAYHMYVDGISHADGRIRYEVGVDLFAHVYPTLSRRNQGRIPLFIKTGRNMPDGSVVDETVSYLRPSQVLAKILSDNLLTQAYTALSAPPAD